MEFNSMVYPVPKTTDFTFDQIQQGTNLRNNYELILIDNIFSTIKNRENVMANPK